VDRLRFALVGAGRFGKKRADAIAKSDCAQLAYVVDAIRDTARDTSQRTGAEEVSFEELLSKRDYDVALVATPNKWHRELTVKLLEAGKDVWCEKPMSSSTNEAREMLLKSIETGRMLKVGSNVRYFPNIMRATELIRKGLPGRVHYFRGWIGNEGLHLLNNSWYARKNLIGRGTLLDNGVHVIDLIRYLVDEIVRCYACKLANIKWRLDIEDNAVAVYDLLNGGIATVLSSWTERSGYMYFEIHGEEGYIHVDSRWSNALLTYGKSHDKPVREDHTQFPKTSYALELEDFVDSYRIGSHPRPTSYDGYRAVKVIFSSYSSASTGEPVKALDQSDEELMQMFTKAFDVDEEYLRAREPE